MLPGPLASGLGPRGVGGAVALPHGGSSQGGEELELQPFPWPLPAQHGLAAVACRGHSSEGAAAGWPVRTPGVTGPGLPRTRWLFALPKWSW